MPAVKSQKKQKSNKDFEIISPIYNIIWSNHSSSLVLIFHQGHHSTWQTRLYENQVEQSIVDNTHMIGQIDSVETMCLRKTEPQTSESNLLKEMNRK